MISPARIEAAARAVRDQVGADWSAFYSNDSARVVALKILAAAFPELAAGTHWLAPVEATEGMCEAAEVVEAGPGYPLTVSEAAEGWRLMRDAYLEEQSDIVAGLAALTEPEVGTWDEIADKLNLKDKPDE